MSDNLRILFLQSWNHHAKEQIGKHVFKFDRTGRAPWWTAKLWAQKRRTTSINARSTRTLFSLVFHLNDHGHTGREDTLWQSQRNQSQIVLSRLSARRGNMYLTRQKLILQKPWRPDDCPVNKLSQFSFPLFLFWILKVIFLIYVRVCLNLWWDRNWTFFFRKDRNVKLTYVIQWFSGKYSDSYHKKLLYAKILIVLASLIYAYIM